MKLTASLPALLFLALLIPSIAVAHEIGLSKSTFELTDATVSGVLSFDAGELLAAFPNVEMDADDDGELTDKELEAKADQLGEALLKSVVMTGNAAPCPSALTLAFRDKDDGIQVEGTWTCPSRPKTLTMVYGLVSRLTPGHRVMGKMTVGSTTHDFIAQASEKTHEWLIAEGGESATSDTAKTGFGLFTAFVVIGVEHIVLGLDHLLFLLALFLVGGSLRQIIFVITAFTVAHSITMGLAILGIWAPSGAIIEPLIAASIVYVGIENLYVKDISRRWILTGIFGLIHGFGFAGAVAEVGLPQDEIVTTLIGFNLGVELGQLSLLLLALPLLRKVWEAGWWQTRGLKVSSLTLAAVGAFWLLERTVL